MSAMSKHLRSAEDVAWEALSSDDYVLTPHEVLSDLIRARDAEVAARTLREAAEDVFADAALRGLQKAHVGTRLRARADRIEREAGERDE